MNPLDFISIPTIKKRVFVILFLLGPFFLSACNKKIPGQSHQELSSQQKAQRQVIQDSIARAQANDMARLALQKEREKMTKQRVDITTSNPDTPIASNSSAASNDSVTNSFVSSGNYTVQVGSWRYQKIANKELRIWKERGYRDAYIATYSKKSTGNVWYRVRLGHIQTYSAAEQEGKRIVQKYGIPFLVSHLE